MAAGEADEKPLCIILLEDDADSRGALAALFNLDGYRVRQAGDAHSFAAAVADHDADAIIFDLNLSDGSYGPDLVARYQQECLARGGKPARLIALSGSRLDLDTAALPCAIDHRFHKPVDYGKLAAAVKK